MSLRNPPDRWAPVSQLLHWATLALIVWLAWPGLSMIDMPGTAAKINDYALHKSLGLTLLGLMLARLTWRSFADGTKPVLSGKATVKRPDFGVWRRLERHRHHAQRNCHLNEGNVFACTLSDAMTATSALPARPLYRVSNSRPRPSPRIPWRRSSP